MSVYVHQIACQVPEYAHDQDTIRQKVLQWLSPDRKTTRYVNRIYRESGIRTRYSVLPESGVGLLAEGGGQASASTGQRNALYTQAARKLYVNVSREVLAESKAIEPHQITHIITVSCTGFFNPGPDYEIITQLKLNPTIQRLHVGFMGCYAAFPALRMAQSICLANPDACVLIAAVELCSLHLQVRSDLDAILGGALFADGAAAVLVSSQAPAARQPAFALGQFGSTLLPDSETDMAWTIGDHGFEMVLSPQVPRLIERHLLDALHPALRRWNTSISDIRHWAVHPGGKAILDRIEAALMLENQLQIPRTVFRQYGNMSSVTILFVLKALLEQKPEAARESVLAMAFGPGLTMEMGLLHKVSPLPLDRVGQQPSQHQAERRISSGEGI